MKLDTGTFVFDREMLVLRELEACIATEMIEVSTLSTDRSEVEIEQGRVIGLCIDHFLEETLSKSFTDLKHLEQLWIMDSDLRTLPENLGDLERLEVLFVGSSKLCTIPPSIGQLKNLAWFEIDYSNLQDLPPSLALCSKMQSVELVSNEFSEVPEVIRHFSNLETLNLCYNPLKQIPSWIGKLSNLKYLLFSNCPECERSIEPHDLPVFPFHLNGDLAHTLPESIRDLPNLTDFYISGLPMVRLPTWLPEFKASAYLHLNLISIYNSLDIIAQCDDDLLSIIKTPGVDLRRVKKQIADWSPNQIVEKLYNNHPLSKVDLFHPDLGPNLNYLLEKIQDVDNKTARDFRDFCNERFSVEIGEQKLPILL